MQCTKIAAAAAALVMMSGASWAGCDNVGAFQCVSGVIHFEAAPNGCFKVNLKPSEGDAVEFGIMYSTTMSAPDLANVIGKISSLSDGSARSILYTGAKTSCSGGGFSLDGPVRNNN